MWPDESDFCDRIEPDLQGKVREEDLLSLFLLLNKEIPLLSLPHMDRLIVVVDLSPRPLDFVCSLCQGLSTTDCSVWPTGIAVARLVPSVSFVWPEAADAHGYFYINVILCSAIVTAIHKTETRGSQSRRILPDNRNNPAGRVGLMTHRSVHDT